MNFNDYDIDKYLSGPSICYGVVVKTGEELEMSDYVGVFIPKLFPYINPLNKGKVEEKKTSLKKDNFLNNAAKEGEKEVIELPYMICAYFNIAGFQHPTHQNGERVIVQFMDKDIKSARILPYSIDDGFKKKADVFTLFVTATGEFGVEPSPGAVYRFTLDSVNKKIVISTAEDKAQDETCFWQQVFDADNGIFYVTDGKRKFQIDFEADSIFWENEDGTKLEITAGDMIVKAKNVTYDVEETFKVTCNDWELESENQTEKTTTLKVEADSGTYDVDQVEWNGTKYEYNYTKWLCNADSMAEISSGIISMDGDTVIDKATFGMTGRAGTPDKPNADGSTFNSTGAGNMPLALATPLVTALTTIASLLDATAAVAKTGGGAASAAATFASSGMTKKSLGS